MIQKDKNQEKVLNVGYHHNEALRKIHSINLKSGTNDHSAEYFNIIEDYLKTENVFTEEIIDANIKNSITFYKSFMDTTNLKSCTNRTIVQDSIGEYLRGCMLQIIDSLYKENSDIAYAFYVIDKIDRNLLSNSDLDCLNNFESTLIASNEYWNNEYWNLTSTLKSSQKIKYPWHPTTWVAINDGIGGLMGSVFGGVGAVILGTIFSAGTNENIKNMGYNTTYTNENQTNPTNSIIFDPITAPKRVRNIILTQRYNIERTLGTVKNRRPIPFYAQP